MQLIICAHISILFLALFSMLILFLFKDNGSVYMRIGFLAILMANMSGIIGWYTVIKLARQ